MLWSGPGRAGLLLAALLLVISVHTFAATTADMEGTVVDADGDPLPGVTIVLSNSRLAMGERGTVTNASGKYRFPQLPPGTGYRLRVSLATFAPVEFTDIQLVTGKLFRQNVVLRPASEVQETIRVRGRAETVDTETVRTSTAFSSEIITGLPVLGQDYQDILTLAPGVSDVDDTGNPNIHGARDTDVLTLVDGVNTTDPLTGYFGQFMNIESIEEIEVITAGANAEFGRAQGGFVNIITKSGGNEFKGVFKLFARSHRLDGDGAGIDDAELRGGLGAENELRDLEFTDLFPFLSFSGALVQDRAWYFLANEFVLIETPVNAVNQVFVTRTRGFREFGKMTWQVNPDNKMALSVQVDRTKDENQGLDSQSIVETGYSFERGGPTYTLKETAVLSPNLFVESSVSWFDNSFQRSPTLDPDTNGNGVLFVDDRPELGGNQDGFFQVSERDPGEDYDQDGAFDVWEDLNHNGNLDDCDTDPIFGIVCLEDLDHDQRLTPRAGCEGNMHEDINCNGILDQETDRDFDGVVDPNEDQGIPCNIVDLCPDGVIPGTQGNGVHDTEDVNRNGVLDVLGTSGLTPFPFWVDTNGNGRPDRGEFVSPVAPDRDYTRNKTEGGRVSSEDPSNPLLIEGGRITGPNPYEFEDERQRFTWREDLSFYVDEFLGSHDVKLGAIVEQETFSRTTTLRPILDILTKGNLFTGPSTMLAFIPTLPRVKNDATSDTIGFYVQDTYKPIPNLTLGLGVRIDFEEARSQGFTPFDPKEEAAQFRALSDVRGLDTDLHAFDPIIAAGLETDPLYSSASNSRVAQLNQKLGALALSRLTRPEFEVDIASRDFGTFTADLGGSGSAVRPRIPEKFRLTNNNLSPRMNVVWDPWANGKSKGFVSWSRYYDKLFLNAVTLEKGLDTVSRYYIRDEDGVDLVGRPNSNVGPVLAQTPPSVHQVDRGVKTPFVDELSIGFERELAPEVSLSVTYVRREFRDQLQNVDVNHFTRIEPSTGALSDRFGTQVNPENGTVIPPGLREDKVLPDGRPDLFIHNFFFNSVSRLGNFNEQSYHGYEVQLTRRLHRQWQMQISYVFSRSEGDAESFLSLNGDDPSLTEFEYGYLDFDQTHVVKFNAVAHLPGDWRLGGTAQWSSGLPFSVIDEFFAQDDIGFVQGRRRFGKPNPEGGFVTESRNSHRNDPAYDFNARVEKNFVMGRTTATGFFEIFNILNSNDLRVFTTQPNLAALQSDEERRFGRRFQIGFQLNF